MWRGTVRRASQAKNALGGFFALAICERLANIIAMTLREFIDNFNQNDPGGPWSHADLMNIFAEKLGVSQFQLSRWYYRSAGPKRAEDIRKIKAFTNGAVTHAELTKLSRAPRGTRRNPPPAPSKRGTGAATD